MTLGERIRWAVEPNQERAMSLLISGTAVFIALGGIGAFIEPPQVVRTLLALGMLAAWTVGFCGVVGFLRWFVRDALKKAKDDDPR
ncbi:MAG TPA: hypothetical protein VEB41_16395 [Burkholderiales bacterium]|nr:hypothetical protein [Burkholderiales bacterium]